MSSNDDMSCPVTIVGARDLGLAVRARRRELELSQQQLADRLGVSRQWVATLEGGHPRAELGLTLRLLRSLDLRLCVEPMDDDGIDLHALVDR